MEPLEMDNMGIIHIQEWEDVSISRTRHEDGEASYSLSLNDGSEWVRLTLDRRQWAQLCHLCSLVLIDMEGMPDDERE